MSIKASEKLRECANHSSAGFFVNLESQFGVSRYWCGTHVIKPSAAEIFNAIADEIDREVTEVTDDYKQAADYWRRMYEESLAERETR